MIDVGLPVVIRDNRARLRAWSGTENAVSTRSRAIFFIVDVPPEAAILILHRSRRHLESATLQPAPCAAALILLIAVLSLAACHRKPSVPPDVVARVGERLVTLGDFKRYLDRNTGTDLAQMGPEVASAMVDQYLEEVILSEYAAGHGVEIPAEKIASAVRNDAGVTVIEKRDEMRRQKLIGDMSGERSHAGRH